MSYLERKEFVLNEKATQTKTPGFGESALALDIVMQLLIDLLVQKEPELGDAMISGLSVLIDAELTPPGVSSALQRMVSHIDEIGQQIH